MSSNRNPHDPKSIATRSNPDPTPHPNPNPIPDFETECDPFGPRRSESTALRLALCSWECMVIKESPDRVPDVELLVPFAGEAKHNPNP